MDMMLWNIVLSALLTVIGWFGVQMHSELRRLSILLNKTREEIVQCQLSIAEKYARKDEVREDMQRVMDRLDALDSKIDRLIETRQ
tara:strand:+ start:49 stop:306 length:258 start_codon:yes stop_codon:yes gene_type:complete